MMSICVLTKANIETYTCMHESLPLVLIKNLLLKSQDALSEKIMWYLSDLFLTHSFFFASQIKSVFIFPTNQKISNSTLQFCRRCRWIWAENTQKCPFCWTNSLCFCNMDFISSFFLIFLKEVNISSFSFIFVSLRWCWCAGMSLFRSWPLVTRTEGFLCGFSTRAAGLWSWSTIVELRYATVTLHISYTKASLWTSF